MGLTCFYKIARIIFLVALFISISCVLTFPVPTRAISYASASSFQPEKLTEGWQYLIDPVESIKSACPWDLADSKWKNFSFTGRQAFNDGRKILWLRVKIPEIKWDDPSIYISVPQQAFEVYTNGNLIYKSGEIDPSGKRETFNLGWNLITLNPSNQGNFVYFRMYSHDNGNLGKINSISLCSKSDIIEKVTSYSLPKLLMAFFFIVSGLILIMIFIVIKCGEKAFISFGVFSVSTGIMTISMSEISEFILNAPGFWFCLYIISIYVIPLAIISFVQQVFDEKSKPSYKYINYAYIICIILVIVLDVTNVASFAQTLSFFYPLWLITIPLLLAAPVKAAMKGDVSAKVYALGLMFLCLSAIYGILVGIGFFTKKTNSFAWGMLLFVISLIIILVQRFYKIYDKLKIYSTEIKVKNNEVTERNAELEAVNAELLILLETLQKTQDQLVQSEKMAALGSLVAGIAHEINTPLGIGVTAASYIERKTKEFTDLYNNNQIKKSDLENHLKESSETISMILSNLHRSSELVKSFKQIASDQSTEEMRKFRVKEYINEVLSSLRPELKKTRHTITVNCSDTLEINSYPGAIYQVLTNFIMNSLIHAYDSGNEGNILISVEEKGSHILLKYKDDGKGIDKNALNKIFDPFFTTKRGKGGTGLGLHIVYNIATKTLGGTIKCESEPGKGTTFIIDCPIKEDILHE